MAVPLAQASAAIAVALEASADLPVGKVIHVVGHVLITRVMPGMLPATGPMTLPVHGIAAVVAFHNRAQRLTRPMNITMIWVFYSVSIHVPEAIVVASEKVRTTLFFQATLEVITALVVAVPKVRQTGVAE